MSNKVLPEVEYLRAVNLQLQMQLVQRELEVAHMQIVKLVDRKNVIQDKKTSFQNYMMTEYGVDIDTHTIQPDGTVTKNT